MTLAVIRPTRAELSQGLFSENQEFLNPGLGARMVEDLTVESICADFSASLCNPWNSLVLPTATSPQLHRTSAGPGAQTRSTLRTALLRSRASESPCHWGNHQRKGWKAGGWAALEGWKGQETEYQKAQCCSGSRAPCGALLYTGGNSFMAVKWLTQAMSSLEPSCDYGPVLEHYLRPSVQTSSGRVPCSHTPTVYYHRQTGSLWQMEIYPSGWL